VEHDLSGSRDPEPPFCIVLDPLSIKIPAVQIGEICAGVQLGLRQRIIWKWLVRARPGWPRVRLGPG
jgi:hypothetical protein